MIACDNKLGEKWHLLTFKSGRVLLHVVLLMATAVVVVVAVGDAITDACALSVGLSLPCDIVRGISRLGDASRDTLSESSSINAEPVIQCIDLFTYCRKCRDMVMMKQMRTKRGMNRMTDSYNIIYIYIMIHYYYYYKYIYMDGWLTLRHHRVLSKTIDFNQYVPIW